MRGRRGEWKRKKVVVPGPVGKVMRPWQFGRREINEFVEENALYNGLNGWNFKSAKIYARARKDDQSVKRLDVQRKLASVRVKIP